ncbi:MAG: trypsin-like peptidase domain-containing protein [Gemmatimonadota bacterium]|nr:trypsin-like peptidase domain-containing protein [Gemmatimonadota bacterium]
MCFFTLGLLLSGGFLRVTAQPATTLNMMEKEMIALVKRVEHSVATVIVQRKHVTNINGQIITDWTRAVGSGVVLHKDGYILTTAGVVTHAYDILVSFPDGQYRSGKIVGVDLLSDIAVIRVDSVSVSPVLLGDSDDALPGAWVLLLSNAYGTPSSISLGIVNGIRKEDVLLQVSAILSRGFTGGAAFSPEGRLIGLIVGETGNKTIPSGGTISSEGSGVVSVIPINRVKTFARHLIEYGEIRRSWLGVYVEKIWDSVNINAELNVVVGKSDGLEITDVFPDSPAEKAGLQKGDRLLEINSISMDHPIMLAEFVITLPIGSKIEIKYLRDDLENITHTVLVPQPRLLEEPPEERVVDEDEALRNLDMLQQMILEHEMEMEKHKLELEQLKQLWQDRVRQVGSSDRP